MNLFTSGHEPHGFLVQPQGNGRYMVLRRRENGWERVREDVPTYVEACGIADALATAATP